MGGTPPRSATALAWSRDFGAFFWGKILGATGVWAYGIAAAVAVFEATGSNVAVAAIAVAQFTPQLVFAPLSGSWADAGHARHQLLIGRAASAAVALGLSAWVLIVDPSGWTLTFPVVAASFVIGLGAAVGAPAMQSVVPGLVRPDELRTAMTLNSAPMVIGRLVGPVVGATAAATIGAGWSFALFAVLQIGFGLLLLVVRFPPTQRASLRRARSVRDAARYVWRNRWLRILLMATAAISLGVEPVLTLTPALSQAISGGVDLVVALNAAFGAGAAVGLILASTALRGRSADALAVGGLLAMVLGLGLTAVSGVAALSLVGPATCGAGMSVALAMVNTALQRDVEPGMRGRLMGFWFMAFMGARPFWAVLLGTISDVFDVRVAFAVCSVAVVVVAVLLWRTVRLRHGSSPLG